jgi:hypothetical protein
MGKVRAENPWKDTGRIRRRRIFIIRGRDSNLLSTETTLIKISKITLLKMNPWGKEEYHQSNVGGVNKITYTRIFLREELKKIPCTPSKRLQQ